MSERTRRGRWQMLGVLLGLRRAGDRLLPGLFRRLPPGGAQQLRRADRAGASDPRRPGAGRPARRPGRVDRPARASGCFVVVAGGACDAACERHLWLQRQLRETLGREKDRVDKLWLVDDAAAPRAETLAAIGAASGAAAGLTPATVLRVDRAALAALARARAGTRARGPPLHRRSARRLDDARPGRRRSGEAEARPREAAARLRGLGPGRAMNDPAARLTTWRRCSASPALGAGCSRWRRWPGSGGAAAHARAGGAAARADRC